MFKPEGNIFVSKLAFLLGSLLRRGHRNPRLELSTCHFNSLLSHPCHSNSHPILAHLPPWHLLLSPSSPGCSTCLLTLQPHPNHLLHCWSGSINSSPLEILSKFIQDQPLPVSTSCHFLQALCAPARLNPSTSPLPCWMVPSLTFWLLSTPFSLPRTLVPFRSLLSFRLTPASFSSQTKDRF